MKILMKILKNGPQRSREEGIRTGCPSEQGSSGGEAWASKVLCWSILSSFPTLSVPFLIALAVCVPVMPQREILILYLCFHLRAFTARLDLPSSECETHRLAVVIGRTHKPHWRGQCVRQGQQEVAFQRPRLDAILKLWIVAWSFPGVSLM